MILSFTIENFYSFRDRVTLDFRASKDIDVRNADAIIELPSVHQRVLKVVGLYGPNAAGKSNFCLALGIFLAYIARSTDKSWMDDHKNIVPFLFDEGQSEKKPTRMEMVFSMHEIEFRYGFEYFKGNFVKEWLFKKESVGQKYKPILMRKDVERQLGMIEFDAAEFKDLPETTKKLVRHDSLFLSLCCNMNVSLASDIVTSICKQTYMASVMSHNDRLTSSLLYKHNQLESKIQEFVRQTDPSVGRIAVQEIKDESVVDGLEKKSFQVKVYPAVAGNRFSKTGIPFKSIASMGTLKAFELAGPMFKALECGGLFVMDEFGSAMHPLLSQTIIRMFNCKESNPKNAQLLFITHDSNLLATRVFDKETGRRQHLLRDDQIWFIERGAEFASSLYSRSEFKSTDMKKYKQYETREDQYLNGAFGAIPFFS